MNRSGGQAIVETLVEQGCEVIFGYPGGAIMPTYDALHQSRGRLRHVLVRHEQGAIHAAEGYARVSGRVGVCLVTSGPGATNLITGLQDALMDSTPIVCITGQVRGAALGTDAFQECDVVGLTLAATKWSVQVADARELPGAIEQAFRIARAGRPGPVLIDVTRDAQTGPADAPAAADPRALAIAHARERWAYPHEARDVSGIERAAALIDGAERPFLLAGQGVLIARAERELRALAEKAGIPVAATLLGLSAFPCDHELWTGMLGMHGRYGANRLTNEADVILAVGMRFDDRVTGRLEDYARQARIIHVDVDPAEIGRHVPVEVPIVADAREALAALLARVRPARHDAWLARFRAHDAEEHAQVIDAEIDPGGGGLRMGEVIDRLSRKTAGAALIVTDVGQHQMIAARHYGFTLPASHVTSGGLGTMGFALPAAIGARIAAPGREVIAVIGDGGFQMTVQELGTIMQERLPVKMIVLNNGHLGMVRQWQELFFDGRYSCVEMDNPDFVAIAAGYRIEGLRVEAREDLDAALDRLLGSAEPFLLEVRVGRFDNVFPMIPAGASVSEIRLS